jgi:peptide/nickel transport system permease protein
LRAAFGLQLGVFFLMVLLIGLFGWMTVARVVRASFLSLKQKEFVEAAYCLGVPTTHIIFRHILPNVLSPVIVSATLAVGAAIITESTLSFLGLGFPPDFPTWGRMLFDAQDYLSISPHQALIPGILIFLTVLSINYVGDGLRDALDPRSLTKA